MFIDLHVHTRWSHCGRMSVPAAIHHAWEKGLDGICITDHQNIDARTQIQEGRQENGLWVFVGMEYATPEGDFLLFGGLENLHEGLSAWELLAWSHDRGVAAVAAHPFRQGRPVQPELLMDGHCRVVETVNGRNTNAENRLAERFHHCRNGVFACGGSDAHTPSEIGSAFTHFPIPVSTTADLVFALNNGLCAPVTVASVASSAPSPMPAVTDGWRRPAAV